MTAGITPTEVKKLTTSRALKGAEWMAENAYIAPGFHRLLTAGGLTLGLYGGRKFMDVLTARNATNGEETPASQTIELMRPLHGVMRYNPYSDQAADRWKFVIDKMAPVAVGAVTAYMGRKYFFNGHLPGKQPFFPAGRATNLALAAKNFSTEITDSAMRMFNSDAIGKWASAVFVEGSSTGQHIFGGLWPFNNGQIAVAFQEGANKNVWFPTFIPGADKVNRLLGNHSAGSRGMYSAMRDMSTWATSNILRDVPVESWATPEALRMRARNGLQMFSAQSEKFEGALANEYRTLIGEAKEAAAQFKDHNPHLDAGYLRKHVDEFISGKINPKRGLLGASHDHLLNGLHAADGTKFDHFINDLAQGPFKFFGRLFGSHKKQLHILEQHAHYLNKEFGYQRDAKQWAVDQLHIEPWKLAATYGGGIAAIGGGLATASVVAEKLHSRSTREHKPHIIDQTSLSHHTQPPASDKPKTDNNLIDWVNDKPLGVAHWISRVLISPPSMHRFMNAAYLSAVLYVGMKGSNILTGRVLTKLNSAKFVEVTDKITGATKLISESVLPIENVWKPLRPLHGVLDYTPGSAEIADRWKQAAHYIMPVALGMFGTWTGSHLYFADRIKSLQKPDTLEDYTDRISMEQSKPYGIFTAFTSIFNTGSGFHLLPVFNYSANLHNRYLLGSGQQVAMPGIGKWWSGNPGTTPWGVKHTLVQLSHYLTFNDAPRPKELRSLVHSVIAKLYPDLDDTELLDKKQVMLDRIHDVRDSYLVEGVVPPSKRAALGEAMHQLFTGTGFEALLQESGLDPAKANLASNGASGAIANFFGSKKAINTLTDEYRSKFAERVATNDNTKPSDFLKSLIDKGPLQPAKPFSERAKAESPAYPVMSV